MGCDGQPNAQGYQARACPLSWSNGEAARLAAVDYVAGWMGKTTLRPGDFHGMIHGALRDGQDNAITWHLIQVIEKLERDGS